MEQTKSSPAPSTHLTDTEKGEEAKVERLQAPIFNEGVDTSGVDERKLIRKLDLWLVPWLSFLYLLSFLDRTSIGNARVRIKAVICYLFA